jgi:hypothetical protein
VLRVDKSIIGRDVAYLKQAQKNLQKRIHETVPIGYLKFFFMIYHNLFVILIISADYDLFKTLQLQSSNVQGISYNANDNFSGCYCTGYDSIWTTN